MLLIVFRLVQGISFGAEFGTAATWVAEQAARSRFRAFWSAWVGFAIPIGLMLGFGSVIVVKSLMTQDAFSAWGWRILFVLGFLVAIVGILIRTRTEDSFVFQRHRTREDVLRYPATQVWRDMPLVILRASLVNAMFGGAFFLYFVFGTSYMKTVGFTGSEPEQIGLIAAAFMLVFMIVGSWLADLIGRRPVLLIAAVVLLFFAIPYFYLIDTGAFCLRPSARPSASGLSLDLVMVQYPRSTPRFFRRATAAHVAREMERSGFEVPAPDRWGDDQRQAHGRQDRARYHGP